MAGPPTVPSFKIVPAYAIEIPEHGRFTVTNDMIVTRCGLKFVELDPKDGDLIKWLTGSRSWSREVSHVLKELEDLRAAAFHTACAIEQTTHGTAYTKQKRAKKIKATIEARCMEVAEVTLPALCFDEYPIEPVVTSMPFRSRGLIQLQLDPEVFRWLWVRCKSVDMNLPRRSVPGGAAHEGKENIYWHKQKGGWVAKRTADSADRLEWKLFKPVQGEEDTALSLEEASGWHNEHD